MKLLIAIKLFKTQSTLSRHRFWLIKRQGNPMFERSRGTPEIGKKRLLDQTAKPTELNQIKVRKTRYVF